MPKVTAIMPTHDVAPFVEESVRAVLAQTFSDFELLVIDDGSTDGTAEIVERIEDPRIRLVRMPHRGLGPTEQSGVEMAAGEYMVRVDGDDLLLPETFEKQAAVLDHHPDTAAVGVWARRFGRRQWLDRPPADPRAIRRRLRRTWVLSQPVMYRTELARKAGGFREVESEDWDLWIRLAKRHDIRAVPEYLALIRERPGSMTAMQSSLRGRVDDLRMRLVALRHLGTDPVSLLVLAKSTAKVVIGWMRVGLRLLPPKGNGLPIPAERPPPVSVVVPTDGSDPGPCLEAVRAQRPPPDEIVARPEDARSDVVAILGPGLAPLPGWLAEIRRAFLDPTIGIVGGAIVGPEGDDATTESYGDVKDVSDANMAIRRELLSLDPRGRCHAARRAGWRVLSSHWAAVAPVSDRRQARPGDRATA